MVGWPAGRLDFQKKQAARTRSAGPPGGPFFLKNLAGSLRVLADGWLVGVRSAFLGVHLCLDDFIIQKWFPKTSLGSEAQPENNMAVMGS